MPHPAVGHRSGDDRAGLAPRPHLRPQITPTELSAAQPVRQLYQRRPQHTRVTLGESDHRRPVILHRPVDRHSPGPVQHSGLPPARVVIQPH
jgi:hypothetical protein